MCRFTAYLGTVMEDIVEDVSFVAVSDVDVTDTVDDDMAKIITIKGSTIQAKKRVPYEEVALGQ